LDQAIPPFPPPPFTTTPTKTHPRGDAAGDFDIFENSFEKSLQNLLQFAKECDIILMFVVRDTTLDVKEHQII
jgi:hypothetical protein